MATVRNALMSSFIGRYGNAVLQLVNVVVLARLLTPTEVGIYSIGVAIASFAHVFRDFGVSTYLIQEKELTKQRVASALAITTIVAFAMGVIVLLVARHAGTFYGEPGVANVLHVLAFSFFLFPIGGMAPALLRRKMDFRTITKIGLLSTATNVAVGIGLALDGYGYMCMAWASLASAAINALLCSISLPKQYRTLPSMGAWRDVLSISAFGGAAGLLKQAGTVGSDLIVGRILTFADLGFFSKARGLLKLIGNYFLSAIVPVAHSKFARTHRQAGELRDDYGEVVAYITVIAYSGYAFLAVLSLPVIRIMFGDQWDAAAPIASLLCVAGCANALLRVNNVLMLSTGRTKTQLKISLATQPLKLLLVFALGIRFDLLGVAYGIVISELVHTLITTVIAFSIVGRCAAETLKILTTSIVIAFLTCLIPIIINLQTDWTQSTFGPLAIATIAAAVTWTCAVTLFRHPITNEFQLVLKTTKSILSRIRNRFS